MLFWANSAMIEKLKGAWPCHGLPDNLASVAATFGTNGDLVDLEAYSFDGADLDFREFDGSALSALVQDIFVQGETTLEP